MNYIEIKNLIFNNTIKYPDITLEKGSITFITGKSGCGKTSLLRLINRTATQSSGEIYIDGQKTENTDIITLRKKLLLVSQSVYLFNNTIKENFRQFYEYRQETPVTDTEMKRFLELCCIDFPLDNDCTMMSGGEKQRIYTAIFLSFSPEVLMLDEPTSALDENTGKDFMKNITSYCKENQITLIVVCHNRKLTDEFAENEIRLERDEKE